MKDTIAYADVLRMLEVLGIDEEAAKQVKSVHVDAHEVTVIRQHWVDGKLRLDGNRLMLTEERATIDYRVPVER